ncbi:MAG: class E sortase [Methanobacterium sp.]
MKLSTVFIIAGMVIISMYTLVEVSYYASANTMDQNRSDVPYLMIPSIGIDQSINNQSIDYGIYHEPASANPGFGTVILAGHRTFHSSPFLNLDKLKAGDDITVSWPGIGNVQYNVVKSYVVPASYQLPLEQGKTLILYTCYPLGSSKERLIIQASQTNILPFNYTTTKNNSDQQFPFAPLIISSFLGVGLILTYIYPVKQDKIILLIAVIALTLFLIYAYIFPIPSNGITSQISNINDWFSF